MFWICLSIVALVAAVGGGVVSILSELRNDFSNHYQDFNRFIENRATAGCCKK